MANIYDIRRYGTVIFFIAVGIVIIGFLYFSNQLVKDLSRQERERMEIWADATKELIMQDSGTDVDFIFSILERNHNIPVLLTDDNGKILLHRNFELPEALDPDNSTYLSPTNEAFLKRKLEAMRNSPNEIDIMIAPGNNQHLYYEDSTLLKRLSYYPYIQLVVMLAFIAVVYFAVLSTKKAEQNKVWVGLSKETAHQLGTPISSLMAWMELLTSLGVDPETVAEMDKDVKRLGDIASRFSKIGSKPRMEAEDLNRIVEHSMKYMSSRISSRITLTTDISRDPAPVEACAPLFEWVMENLIKNAVDATEGSGAISVSTGTDHGKAFIEVGDTGKGIPRKNFKTIFNPGFTTKKRGWGLGLTLAKRIIEEYHSGKIFVKSSEIGSGTLFRMELPLTEGKLQKKRFIELFKHKGRK